MFLELDLSKMYQLLYSYKVANIWIERAGSSGTGIRTESHQGTKMDMSMSSLRRHDFGMSSLRHYDFDREQA